MFSGCVPVFVFNFNNMYVHRSTFLGLQATTKIETAARSEKDTFLLVHLSTHCFSRLHLNMQLLSPRQRELNVFFMDEIYPPDNAREMPVVTNESWRLRCVYARRSRIGQGGTISRGAPTPNLPKLWWGWTTDYPASSIGARFKVQKDLFGKEEEKFRTFGV